MKQSIFLFVLICLSSAEADSITYSLEPTSLSGHKMSSYAANGDPLFLYPEGDYGLIGGYITTDGTIGELQAENIIDYRIDIGGPVPYVFTPAKTSELRVSGLLGGAESLTMAPQTPGAYSVLTVFEDNPSAFCEDCVRFASWIGGSDTHGYPTRLLYEVEDMAHFSVPNVSIIGPVSQVASVPEPSAYFFAPPCLIALGFLRKRRERS